VIVIPRETNAVTLIELLAERFPNCFAFFERRRRPLKIGIQTDIQAALDGAVKPKELGRALRIYCVNRGYCGRRAPAPIAI